MIQGSVPSKGLRVASVDALPANRPFAMSGEGLLDQPVFGIDVGVGHAVSRSGRLSSMRDAQNPEAPRQRPEQYPRFGSYRGGTVPRSR